MKKNKPSAQQTVAKMRGAASLKHFVLHQHPAVDISPEARQLHYPISYTRSLYGMEYARIQFSA